MIQARKERFREERQGRRDRDRGDDLSSDLGSLERKNEKNEGNLDKMAA